MEINPSVNSSSPPSIYDYGVITSPAEREAAGIRNGSDFVDIRNSLAISQYNNDYDRWKTLWEAEYNSPENQVARLRAAGLNPNYNSIDGTGNINADGSKATIAQNYSQSRNARISNILTGVNTALNAISKGVEMTSEISGIPADISGYRTILNQLAQNENFQKHYGAEVSQMNSLLKKFELRDAEMMHRPSTGEFSTLDTNGLQPYDEWLASPAGRKLMASVEGNEALANIRNAAATFDEITKNPEYAEALVKHLLNLMPIEELYQSGRAAVSNFEGETVEIQKGLGYLLKFLTLLK
ncbi:minor capsid protein [Capybara microvirus Cap3_SP_612]|nr:minor capsid protein [Capybara microvirus Cap3_SP_612]